MLSREEFERMTGLSSKSDNSDYLPSRELCDLKGLRDFNSHEALKDRLGAPLIIISKLALKSCLCIPAYQGNEEFEEIITEAQSIIDEFVAISKLTHSLGLLDHEDFKDIDSLQTLAHGTAEEICALAIGLVAGEFVDESILEVTPDYPNNAPSLTTRQNAVLCMGMAIKSIMPIVDMVLLLRKV